MRHQNTIRITTKRRTGIVTVNRNCLTQDQHTALLSTPKGHAWTGSRGLSFIIEKCRKIGRPAGNSLRRETGKHESFDVNTIMWSQWVLLPIIIYCWMVSKCSHATARFCAQSIYASIKVKYWFSKFLKWWYQKNIKYLNFN